MTGKKIKALIFDFDGVIVADSEFIKEAAWDVITDELGDNSVVVFKQARVKYGNGKGSRYDILKDALLVLGYSAGEISGLVEHYAQRYNEVVQKELLNKGIRKIDKDALKILSKYYSLYINSATPEEAIRESVKKLEINQFFKSVFGQPKKKVESLSRVLEAEKIIPTQMIFIGDDGGDYNVAKQIGCRFIGIANDWNRWDKTKSFLLVNNLSELGIIVESLK